MPTLTVAANCRSRSGVPGVKIRVPVIGAAFRFPAKQAGQLFSSEASVVVMPIWKSTWLVVAKRMNDEKFRPS